MDNVLVGTSKLKDMARRCLKDGSALKNLILSEPDYVQKEEIATKVVLFHRILQQDPSCLVTSNM